MYKIPHAGPDRHTATTHNTLKPQTSNSKNQKRYTCTLAAQNTKEQEEQYKHPTTSASLHCLIKGWS
jgi:hypothetical protein